MLRNRTDHYLLDIEELIQLMQSLKIKKTEILS